jgi:hypothetical protein
MLALSPKKCPAYCPPWIRVRTTRCSYHRQTFGNTWRPACARLDSCCRVATKIQDPTRKGQVEVACLRSPLLRAIPFTTSRQAHCSHRRFRDGLVLVCSRTANAQAAERRVEAPVCLARLSALGNCRCWSVLKSAFGLATMVITASYWYGNRIANWHSEPRDDLNIGGR